MFLKNELLMFSLILSIARLQHSNFVPIETSATSDHKAEVRNNFDIAPFGYSESCLM
jgi:hypothetical protein